MRKIAIKISSNRPFSKYVAPLRRYMGLGITEIKNKIVDKDFFAETDANDIDRLKEIMEELQDYDDNLSDEI